MDPHRLAELRSIALHHAVAAELRRRPELVEAARARLRAWTAEGKTHAYYRDEWLIVLSQPLERLVELITEDNERGRELRQTTPFAGLIPPRERWRIWQSVRDAA
jgi:hypothetical protein